MPNPVSGGPLVALLLPLLASGAAVDGVGRGRVRPALLALEGDVASLAGAVAPWGNVGERINEVLGYSSGDGQILHDNIVSAISGQEPSKTTTTEHGLKYEYEIKLPSRDDVSTTANVTIVVQRDNGSDDYRIITLVPRKKD